MQMLSIQVIRGNQPISISTNARFSFLKIDIFSLASLQNVVDAINDIAPRFPCMQFFDEGPKFGGNVEIYDYCPYQRSLVSLATCTHFDPPI